MLSRSDGTRLLLSRREAQQPPLEVVVSWRRDFAFCEGFNPRMRLTRTQTIMEGASHCDFRFELRREPSD